MFLRNRAGISVLNEFSPVSGDAFVCKVSKNGTLLWAAQYGSSDPGDESGYSVATDSQNNVYTAGTFVSTAIFGLNDGTAPTLTSYGASDAFLVKASSSGSTIWVTQYGGPYNDRAVGVAVDCQDNVFVTGQVFPSPNNTVRFGSGSNATLVNTSMDMFLSKTAPNGTLLWVNTYGGSTADDSGLNVAIDCQTGSAVVTGYFSSVPSSFGGSDFAGSDWVLNPANGSKDGFVLRVNAQGTTEWVLPVGGSDADSMLGVAVDQATGDALVTGQSCSPALTFGTGDNTTVLPNLPSFDRAGSVLCASSTSNSYLARVARNGTLLWTSPLTGVGDVSGQDIAMSPTGEVIAAGFFRGFSASFGAYNENGGRGSRGGVFTSASNTTAIVLSNSNIGADAQAFVIKASAAGTMLWALGMGNDQALGVSVDGSSGTLVVSGTMGQSPSMFPNPQGGVFKSRGGRDTWIAQVFLCATGQFLNSSGCFLCKPGYYCPGGTQMTACGFNFYCPQGSAMPIACNIGQLTLSNTSSSCVFAPPPPAPPPPLPPAPPRQSGARGGVIAVAVSVPIVVVIVCVAACVYVAMKKGGGGGDGNEPLRADTSGVAMGGAPAAAGTPQL